MKTKLIFTAIVAAIFIAAMIIYRETIGLPELISYFVGASGAIVAVWKWLEKNKIVAQKQKHIARLQRDFKHVVGMDTESYFKRKR